jgi:hypothetical protein
MSVRRIALILLALAGSSLGIALLSAERVRAEDVAILAEGAVLVSAEPARAEAVAILAEDTPLISEKPARAEAVVINDALQLQGGISKPQKLAQLTTASVGPRASERDLATIRAAAELVRAKKGEAALAKLEPLARRLAGNPDFDYVYGAAALDAGHPAQAATALRRALAARPDFHLARAELGRALAAMGDLSGAKREFEVVRTASGVPAAARDAMGRQVVAIDQAVTQTGPANAQAGPVKAAAPPPPRTQITGYIENAIGYDTNVNSGPSAASILIPLFINLGPAAIPAASQPKKSGFYELTGGLAIAHALNEDTALFANAVGNVHLLFDNREFRSAYVGGEAGIARKIGDFGTFALALIAQSYFIGDNDYRNIYGIAAQWRRRFADAWDASLVLSWLGFEYGKFLGAPIDGQDADRFTIGGTLSRRFEDMPSKPSISLTVNAGKELARNDSADHLSFTLLGVRGGLEMNIAPPVVVFLQAGYEKHWYDADFPAFFVHRADDIYDVLGGFDVKVTDKLSLRPTLRYSETKSNVDLFDQKRWVGSMAARWSF